MLSGNFTVGALGSGRIRLPLEFVELNSISYAQPIVVVYEQQSGVQARFLCTASVAVDSGSCSGSFDPSIQGGLEGILCCSPADLLSVTVKALNSKPTTATSLKPTVFCQVLAVSPAGPASTVYRVVPSTDIQLVTHNSSSSGSSGQESQAIGSTQQEAGGSAQPGSSSNSKTCSRPKSSSSHGQAAADTAKLPSSVFDKGKGSSSSSSTKKKKTCLTSCDTMTAAAPTTTNLSAGLCASTMTGSAPGLAQQLAGLQLSDSSNVTSSVPPADNNLTKAGQQLPQQHHKQAPAITTTAGSSSSSSISLIAGLEGPLSLLRELVGWPLQHAAAAAELGVIWPRGVLLHGPPGCGKTLLVKTIAAEFGAELHVVTPGAVFGAFLGESERRLREVFEAAAEQAAAGALVIIFLDEVDALCPRRGAGGGSNQHEARVVAQLLTLLDGAAALESTSAAAGRLVVIAATNRPNAIDPALRRPGRLDREVSISVPDELQRTEILKLHCGGLCLSPDVDLASIAASCHGYSGADLSALVRQAAMHAFTAAADKVLAAGGLQQTAAALADLSTAPLGAAQAAADGCVTAADFAAAMHRVGPSIVRGAAVEVSAVQWSEVGGYEGVKKRLQQAVQWPLQHADSFKRLGLSPPRGVLLHGPPGCSKTMLARAAATASKATFIPLSCAQLYGMYVGEGEATLRDTFRRARLACPSIIFLDEADALAPRRQEGGEDNSSSAGPEAGLRLLSTLLTEIDGLEETQGVLLLAATNRPAALDPALLRPGRLDVLLCVPPPDLAGRLAILQLHTKKMPLADDVDLKSLAVSCKGYTGAELAGLCREAAMSALREDVKGAQQVFNRHFLCAVAGSSPALTASEVSKYETWGKQYSR